jgi:hypothetical protein
LATLGYRGLIGSLLKLEHKTKTRLLPQRSKLWILWKIAPSLTILVGRDVDFTLLRDSQQRVPSEDRTTKIENWALGGCLRKRPQKSCFDAG